MTEVSASLSVAVLLGSVRRNRQGLRVARMVMAALRAAGHNPTLVDPQELNLPLLDRMYKEYPPGEAPAPLERLATLYREADGFVIVSAEYNNSIPPALSNLLDHFLEEYFWRPSAIVCYSAGAFGGVRAAMQLRAMLAEMGMPSIPSLLPIPRVGSALDEDGTIKADAVSHGLGKFMAEFTWYALALRRQRAGGTPY